MNLTIRRLDNYNYDVFMGTGWDQWSRIRRGKHNTFSYRGVHLDKNTLTELHNVLSPDFPINYGQSVEVTLNNLNQISK